MATQKEVWELEYRADTTQINRADDELRDLYQTFGLVEMEMLDAAQADRSFATSLGTAGVNVQKFEDTLTRSRRGFRQFARDAREASESTGRLSRGMTQFAGQMWRMQNRPLLPPTMIPAGRP